MPQNTTIRVQVLWIRYGTEGTLLGAASTPSGQFSPPDQDEKTAPEIVIGHQPVSLPEVSIAAGAGITEGGSAVFNLVASPAPYQELSVSVTVADSGDFAAGGQAGSRTITVPATGSVSFSVSTDDDGVDEADGTLTATLAGGFGYTLGAATASVAVADDDGGQSEFVPDPNLVKEVEDKGDNHANPDAAERLRKIVKGMKGEGGGYTSAQCRDVADDHGVSSTWEPWCAEIERRENWAS